MKNWKPSFYKAMEKIAVPIMPLIMGATTLNGIKDTTKENIDKTRLQSTQRQEQQLQLPGASSMNFEGSKRIDSERETATNKF